MRNKNESHTKSEISLKFKLIIVLLFVFALGQFSSTLLPAMAGTSPKPESIFGSMLWVGLLFMAIWSAKSKKKLIGFILGALIGLALNFGCGVYASYLNAEERAIDKAVEESNKNLPKMVDEETWLDKASINQKDKIYSLHLSTVNLTKDEVDLDILIEHYEEAIKPSICNNEVYKLFLRESYSIKFIYKDKNNLFIKSFITIPSDC